MKNEPKEIYVVEPLGGGRFAVTGAGETLFVFHCEGAAMTAAAALNGGPVLTVGGGRWSPPPPGYGATSPRAKVGVAA